MQTGRKYDPKKESRGWYYVEYHPPVDNNKYAILNLVVVQECIKQDIVKAMEKETKIWLIRYPVPLFVSAFDDSGVLCDLGEIKSCNHVIGFFDQENKMCLHWRLLKNEELPDIASDHEYINNLYSDFNFKTYAELDTERQKWRKQIKLGWFIFFVWLVIIPALIAVLEYYSNWLAFIALLYSLYKATQKGLELTGRWPKSKRKKENEEKERLKDHYYYHCQMNPDGFKRLMLENFDKMAKDEIAREAKSIKK